ncbi:MAG: hypothetical protein AABY22_34840, partial [Nanoarchaeota archaeon]
ASLLGAGFTNKEVTNIESDINKYGINSVLEGITDPAQKKAIQDAYGVKQKVTREQVVAQVTQKVAYEALKDSYTENELFDFATEAGATSLWTNKTKDIERWLNSESARNKYIDLLYQQYKSAGLAQ